MIVAEKRWGCPEYAEIARLWGNSDISRYIVGMRRPLDRLFLEDTGFSLSGFPLRVRASRVSAIFLKSEKSQCLLGFGFQPARYTSGAPPREKP